jgi:hypothetical protein
LRAVEADSYTGRPAVSFRVGQLVQHRKFDTVLLVTGWNETCCAGDAWVSD